MNPTMEDSSDDDFINLPGPSTRARVKRKEWPATDDPGGTSSNKVGGASGRAPKGEKSKENMSKEEKKREASRIRMAKMRAKKTDEKKKEDQEADRIRKAKKKAEMSDEQKNIARDQNKQNNANHRANMTNERKEEVRVSERLRKAQQKEAMTEDEKAVAREANRQAVADHRANMPEERQQEVRRSERLRKMQARADMTEDEQAETREQDRIRKAIHRKITDSKVTLKDGLRTDEILRGEFHVPLLENSFDSIGRMEVQCQHCGANKFKKETPGSCCSNGKVDLEPFPRPPPELMNLWTGNGRNARIFRQFTREINNASCLSSIKVTEKRFNGFSPSVIFKAS